MRFDFINENQRVRYRDRDAATKRKIRNKAGRASALTKGQKLQTPDINSPKHPVKFPVWSADDIYGVSDNRKCLQAKESVRKEDSSKEEYFEADGRQVRREKQTSSTLLYRDSFNFAMNNVHLSGLLAAPHVKHILIGQLLNQYDVRGQYSRLAKAVIYIESDLGDAITHFYGKAPYLDSAIECLGARIREFLASPQETSEARQLYGRTLQHVQKALAEAIDAPQHEMWYACMLLILFELLDRGKDRAWITHAKGAGMVLKALGGRSIQTPLQKSLLASLAHSINYESLIGSMYSFLVEKDWQSALRRCIDPICDTWNVCGELPLSYAMHFAFIPNHINLVAKTVITNAGTLHYDTTYRGLLVVKKRLSNWYSKFVSALRAPPTSDDLAQRWLMAYLAAMAMLNRLLSSVAPLKTEASDFEHDAQALAEEVLITTGGYARPSSHQSVHIWAAIVAAQAIVATSSEWKQHIESRETDASVLRDVFNEWMRLMGRVV